MKETYEALLISRIRRFTQEIDRIAEDRKGDGLKIEPTAAHLYFLTDDANNLPIELCISVDPRRLAEGEDGLGGEGVFIVRSYMSTKGFATLISELIEFAMEIGIVGDGADHAPIIVDGECTS
jgi:hypothetical protein